MRDRKWLRTLLICMSSLTVLYFFTALVLIHCPEPEFSTPPFFSVSDADNELILNLLKQDYEYRDYRFKILDGVDLYARYYDTDTDVTVVLLHGIRENSYIYNTSCGMIRESAEAEIFALDLRGHGKSSGKRGDIDYIGQYEDDVADVIADIRTKKPGGKVILAGHSMGGGIALRYAIKYNPSNVDGYLLFAPHLGFNSPTVNPPKPEASSRGEPEFKLHALRLAGLFMLNIFGIDGFNSLPIAFFNEPSDSPESPPNEYSYRAFSSMAPTDYKAGLASVDKPLLVLIGNNDEPFYGAHFEPVVRENGNGEVILFEGLNHQNIMFDEKVIAVISAWMKKL